MEVSRWADAMPANSCAFAMSMPSSTSTSASTFSPMRDARASVNAYGPRTGTRYKFTRSDAAAGTIARRIGSARRLVRIEKDGHALHEWEGLRENLKALNREFRTEVREAGDVPAWVRDASDNTRGDGISDCCCDYGNGLQCGLRRKCSRCPMSHEDIHLETLVLCR